MRQRGGGGGGQDATSFLMGQRAALQQCFREALPPQQTLGALQAAVADLRGFVDQYEGAQVVTS